VFTIRNMGGVALFLFGTTFLWLTPSFAGAGISTKSWSWSVTQWMSFATVIGFTLAMWGLFKRTEWWEGAAIASAVLGVLVLPTYWLAASKAGEVNPAFNVAIHALGDAGVFVLLLVPALERWVSGHVMAGR
jgi:hypothetical protein